MPVYEYIHEGKPLVLQRHRHTKWGTYNPSKQAQDQFVSQLELPTDPIPDMLAVELEFCFEMPKSYAKLKDKPAYPSRCDLDNLIKFVLDALNKKLYRDDSQIIMITAIKKYDATAKTVMRFIPLAA
jgi:Holliday junction resolvase RusA-like endonuclease